MRGTNLTTTSPRGPFRRLARPRVTSLGIGLAAWSLVPWMGWAPQSTAVAQVPGAESFQPEPRTPRELWHAVDYLIRTDQAKSALPYLQKFAASKPDDATLMAIRDRYGAGSFLKLDDHPETKKYAEPLIKQLSEATRRHLTHPERIERFVSELTRTPEERRYAISRLREAGAYAIPSLVEALSKPGLSSSDRSILVSSMGRLDAKAVPALIAVLDSPDPAIAADAATALGSIGDGRALPFLTIKAADGKQPVDPKVKSAARDSIARITGRSLEALPQSPVQLLTDAAWSYHRHRVEFPGDTVAVWQWNTAENGPDLIVRTKAEAESDFARKFGRAAVDLDPNDFKAKVALLSAELELAAARTTFDEFEAEEAQALAAAVAAGPEVLTQVMRDSIADRKPTLTAATVLALGKASRNVPFAGPAGYAHPLVEALAAPGRRAQLAAARAIIAMEPKFSFPGSSRLVPVLARFIDNQPQPRGVVIDGNPNRGSRIAGLLKELGYDSDTELNGADGFRAATETADVEVLFISYDLFQGSWNLSDTLSNFRSDPRTELVPIFVYGPLHLMNTRPGLTELYPGIKFLVQPSRAADLEWEMGGRPSLLSPRQRTGYAAQAAELLARVAAQGPNSPFASDLPAIEPSVTQALNQPTVAVPAAKVLGGMPSPSAQQALADVILDAAFPLDVRKESVKSLTRSIKQFGALAAADQEIKLEALSRTEPDAVLKKEIRDAIGTIRSRRVDNSPVAARTARGARSTAND